MNIYSLAVCLSEIVWFYVYAHVYIMYMHTDCICISVYCVHGISCSRDHCEPSWLMHLRSCVERDVHPCEERDVHPCGYQSAASSHPDGIWPMQLSFLLNASLMSQRDHTTSLSCAVRFRASAAQGSSWPWPLAGFVQLRCLTLVHCHWGSCRWVLRVCKLKPCKIRKVKTGRTEHAELGTLLGIGGKYWRGI